MNGFKLSLRDPEDMARSLAARLRQLRLLEGWTRVTLAGRAGVSAASLKRFENTGKASLALVLKVAHALGRLDELEPLFGPPRALSLAELERQSARRGRKRGSK